MAEGTAWQALGRQFPISAAFAIVEPRSAPLAIQNVPPAEVSIGDRIGRAAAAGGGGGASWADPCATALGASGSDGSRFAASGVDTISGVLPALTADGTLGWLEFLSEIWAAATLVPLNASATTHKAAFAVCNFIYRSLLLRFDFRQ